MAEAGSEGRAPMLQPLPAHPAPSAQPSPAGAAPASEVRPASAQVGWALLARLQLNRCHRARARTRRRPQQPRTRSSQPAAPQRPCCLQSRSRKRSSSANRQLRPPCR